MAHTSKVSQEQLDIFKEAFRPTVQYWQQMLQALIAGDALKSLSEEERKELYKSCELTERHIRSLEKHIEITNCFMCNLLNSRCMKH